ncbi:MAG: heavy metal translocating P-type ATPase [Solirubrobacterales bacterium]|nr:heavy metal translocating P-type ATPase [Solirubrobacterales bacterium]
MTPTDLLDKDRHFLLSLSIFAAIVVGGAFSISWNGSVADLIWAVAIVVSIIPLTMSTTRSLLKGDVGVDVIALLAMAGALALGEYLAGAVVALMMSGGGALEAYADQRARRELTMLLERAPRAAHRYQNDALEQVDVEEVEVGDLVLVRTGEVVPIDGTIESDGAMLDESTLTGEPLPVLRHQRESARSGIVNAGSPFDLRATHRAEDSTYSALVSIVQAAERERPPFTRMADRYAVFFLSFTVFLCGVAWLVSGDPVRALAVLVVATPCPLILAAPIAIVAGLSRAANRGVIVKGGGTMEQLANARTMLLDKTGTLTLGTPEIESVETMEGTDPDELLRLAASLEQASAHVLAEAMVRQVAIRGVLLESPSGVEEEPGGGIDGLVGGYRVTLGSRRYLNATGIPVDHEGLDRLEVTSGLGQARIAVAVDGKLAGVILMGDRLRDDAPTLVQDLHSEGLTEVAMLTGDRAEIAEEVGKLAGLDRIYSDQSPEDKLDVVREFLGRPEARPVVMVGDGVNDAPAIASADVGIALGAAGATVSSQTADAVIVVNRIDRLLDVLKISRRTMRIARQSVLAGMGLSIAAMFFAAAGFIEPVQGALLQEVIDVAVILNALRALKA